MPSLESWVYQVSFQERGASRRVKVFEYDSQALAFLHTLLKDALGGQPYMSIEYNRFTKSS